MTDKHTYRKWLLNVLSDVKIVKYQCMHVFDFYEKKAKSFKCQLKILNIKEKTKGISELIKKGEQIFIIRDEKAKPN